MSAPKVIWKYKALLDKEGVSIYSLAKKLSESADGSLSMRTLYRWSNETPSNPSLEGIAWVLWGVEELTGKTFQISDVLEYQKK